MSHSSHTAFPSRRKRYRRAFRLLRMRRTMVPLRSCSTCDAAFFQCTFPRLFAHRKSLALWLCSPILAFFHNPEHVHARRKAPAREWEAPMLQDAQQILQPMPRFWLRNTSLFPLSFFPFYLYFVVVAAKQGLDWAAAWEVWGRCRLCAGAS